MCLKCLWACAQMVINARTLSIKSVEFLSFDFVSRPFPNNSQSTSPLCMRCWNSGKIHHKLADVPRSSGIIIGRGMWSARHIKVTLNRPWWQIVFALATRMEHFRLLAFLAVCFAAAAWADPEPITTPFIPCAALPPLKVLNLKQVRDFFSLL